MILLLLTETILHGEVVAQSQPETIVIRGCLLSYKGHEGVPDAYIRVSSKKRPHTLAYVNTGKENCFQTKISFAEADTFFITASHAIYESVTISRYITKSDVVENLEIVMPLQSNVLGEVVVRTPPVWVRGDTTFFKADFFKEGEEQKLRDLIVKMPGFELDQDGNLLYRKRKIEKLTIEGEEIFADRIKLLLGSFPVHVLNTVQAVENQADNKLLKGLTAENKVYLNLGIKKEKLKAAFGDGEISLGTNNRYSFAPTLFGLYTGAKIGFIGNENNTGAGFDWGEENELKNHAGKDAEEWMMTGPGLQTINNFASKRYIANRKWDNRVQVNIPVTNKIKSQTTISLLKDRQIQDVYAHSALYNDSLYIKRADTTSTRLQPSVFSFCQNIDWAIDPSRELKTSFQFYHNTTVNRYAGLYREASTAYAIENRLANNWKSFSFNSEYTHRHSATRATRWFATASQSQFNQRARGVSPDWPVIFGLPYHDHTQLDQTMASRIRSATAGAELLKKTKTGLFTHHLQAEWLSVAAANNTLLRDPGNAATAINPDQLAGQGLYEKLQVSGYSQKSFNVFRKPLFLKLNYGAAHASIHEIKNKKSFTTPLYGIEINQRTKISEPVTFFYAIAYAQKQADVWNWHEINLPAAIGAYHRNANISESIRTFTGNAALGINWGNFTSSFINLSYRRNFSGFVTSSGFHQLLQTSIDTLVLRPMHTFHAGTNLSFVLLPIKAKLELGSDHSIATGFIPHKGNLLPLNYHWHNFMIIVKRNWNKKYFLTLESRYLVRRNILPAEISGQMQKTTSDLKIAIQQRALLRPNLSLSLQTEWYAYNRGVVNRSNAFFADAEARYSLPGKPWSFHLQLSNITNQRFFYFQHNTTLAQNFYALPLTQRNLMVGLRYEL